MSTAVVGPRGGRPSHPQLKGGLSLSRRRLVELMQQINFGRLEGVPIRDAEPVLDHGPAIVREIKFGGENSPRPELAAEDFLLKREVVELLAYLDQQRDGVIDVLEVKHGLPFRMTVREASA